MIIIWFVHDNAIVLQNQIAAPDGNLHQQSSIAQAEQLKAARETLRAQQAQHQAQLQQLQHQHHAAMEEAGHMSARRSSETDQFTYCVRGSEGQHMQGSVPRSIFDAELDSVLARMYSGEWEYAKDDRGRALVNSDPVHWPFILNWLSFGAVPDPSCVSPAFLAECRYWQLDQLLEQLDAAKPSAAHAVNDVETKKLISDGIHDFTLSLLDAQQQRGFILQGHFCNFLERRAAGSVQIEFKAYGCQWRLSFRAKNGRLALSLLQGPPVCCPGFKYWLGPDEKFGPFNIDKVRFVEGTGFGTVFTPNDASPFQGMVDLSGNLKVKLQVILPTVSRTSRTAEGHKVHMN